mmetsp:Transcript_5379/g.5135  ORF Transcript_5379/g.5135 Transcript_5379/m.5135 type:complete len:141 (+) Transcript_5379:222-644(+)
MMKMMLFIIRERLVTRLKGALKGSRTTQLQRANPPMVEKYTDQNFLLNLLINKEKHHLMLNENRRASEIIKKQSSELVRQIDNNGNNIAKDIVEDDIHEQEQSLKIRLLKRQNNKTKKLAINNSFSFWSESSISRTTDDN